MQNVDVKIHEQIATILIERKAFANALNSALIEELQQAFSDVHQEKRVRAVVLAGAGKHFCSGMDLRAFKEISDLPPQEAITHWHDLWRQLTELLEDMLRFPKPIVSAVDGMSIGAGFGLALAADMIVPTTDASFSAEAVRRGLAGGATTALLAFRGGAAVAARMCLMGTPVSAEEAYRLGLCMAPVSPSQVWVSATEVAKQCSEGPGEAVQATKRILNESIGESLIMQLSATAADSAAACSTESAAEGIRAYLERREPNWP